MLSLAAVALAIVGCGGSSSSSMSSTQPTTTAGSEGPGAAATISTAEVSGLGMVLVDSEGLTVYSFAKDNGTTSSCYGACAESWPPVLLKGKPAAGEGATASKLGATERKDGTMQVTYAGHPLYTFIEDRNGGEANGNGSTAFGGVWQALDGSGSPAVASSGEESGSSAPAESGEESSGGYGY